MKQVPFDLFAPPRSQSVLGGAADNPMSVGDLTFWTREVVESRMRPVWVRGEISDIDPGALVFYQRVHKDHARAHLNRFGDFLRRGRNGCDG